MKCTGKIACILLFLLSLGSLPSCGSFQLNRSAVVEHIKLGMSRQEVKNYLGSPTAVSMEYNEKGEEEVSWFFEELLYSFEGTSTIHYRMIFVNDRLVLIDPVRVMNRPESTDPIR